MLERVIYDEWLTVFPVVAFATAALLFGALSWRALRMKSAAVERFARMPLDDGEGDARDARTGPAPASSQAAGVKPAPPCEPPAPLSTHE